MRITVTNKAAKKTRTTKKPSKKGKTTSTKKGGAKVAKTTQRLNGRGSEPQDVGQSAVESPAHALYARNLCGFCPDGVTPQKRSLFARHWGATGPYCGCRLLVYCSRQLAER